ncbi:MAG: hypothetical protein VX589_05205 [Myxococcota bacterium]|nr:hypothetical protein [Myxococcota bacterium]
MEGKLSMPNNDISLTLDMQQGFNFRKDVMTKIGFVTALKIGDTDMAKDFTLKDPENSQNDKKVVGVLSYLNWSGSPTEPVNLNVQVSEDAKNKLDVLTRKNMSNVEVQYQFDCYNYDPKEKKYFKNFHANSTDMKGLIHGEGRDLAITMHLDPNGYVQEPANYTLELGIKPQATQQDLHYASSVSDKLVMQWGVSKSG